MGHINECTATTSLITDRMCGNANRRCLANLNEYTAISSLMADHERIPMRGHLKRQCMVHNRYTAILYIVVVVEDCRSLIEDHGSLVADHGLWIINIGSQSADFRLRVAGRDV